MKLLNLSEYRLGFMTDALSLDLGLSNGTKALSIFLKNLYCIK